MNILCLRRQLKMTWKQFITLGNWNIAWNILDNLDKADQERFSQLNQAARQLYRAYLDHSVAVFEAMYIDYENHTEL